MTAMANHRRDHNDRNNCAYHAIARGNGLICRRFLCERLLLNGLRLGDARFLLGLRAASSRRLRSASSS